MTAACSRSALAAQVAANMPVQAPPPWYVAPVYVLAECAAQQAATAAAATTARFFFFSFFVFLQHWVSPIAGLREMVACVTSCQHAILLTGTLSAASCS
jgi:hypothetical protein